MDDIKHLRDRIKELECDVINLTGYCNSLKLLVEALDKKITEHISTHHCMGDRHEEHGC